MSRYVEILKHGIGILVHLDVYQEHPILPALRTAQMNKNTHCTSTM